MSSWNTSRWLSPFSSPSSSPSTQDLNVRGKNKKEKLAGIFSSFHKTGDELLLSGTQKDVDEFFEHEKVFILLCLHPALSCHALEADILHVLRFI